MFGKKKLRTEIVAVPIYIVFSKIFFPIKKLFPAEILVYCFTVAFVLVMKTFVFPTRAVNTSTQSFPIKVIIYFILKIIVIKDNIYNIIIPLALLTVYEWTRLVYHVDYI